MECKICRAGEVVPHGHISKYVADVLEGRFGRREEAISLSYLQPDRLSDLLVLVFEFLVLLLDLLEEPFRFLFLDPSGGSLL